MQDAEAAASFAAGHERARDEAAAALHAAQARVAALEDTAAATEATQRTEALQSEGVRERARSLEARGDALEERCARLQDETQRVRAFPAACARRRTCMWWCMP